MYNDKQKQVTTNPASSGLLFTKTATKKPVKVRATPGKKNTVE
jgi:hypothetical protein